MGTNIDDVSNTNVTETHTDVERQKTQTHRSSETWKTSESSCVITVITVCMLIYSLWAVSCVIWTNRDVPLQWVRVFLWVSNWSVGVYLQSSVLTERRHALHETAHLVCNRLNDCRQNPGNQILRYGEDLRDIEEEVERGRGGRHKIYLVNARYIYRLVSGQGDVHWFVVPQRERWWCWPELLLGNSLHLRYQKDRTRIRHNVESDNWKKTVFPLKNSTLRMFLYPCRIFVLNVSD